MDKLLRVVIVDDNLNDAETMISTIKSAGFAVRAERATDPEGLQEVLRKHPPDLLLCTLGLESLDLQQVVRGLREAGRHSPIIALGNGADGEVVESMELGAEDVVRKDNADHLRLVVARTARCQQQWRELKTYESSLREVEKRCRTLLNTSRDAIAYVHEGMHIYTNDSYLELFGYTDSDEVEGTPIMDMAAPEQQPKMKEFLRNYGKEGEENQTLNIRLRDTRDHSFDAAIEFSPASIDGEPCTQLLIRNQGDAKALEQQLNYLSQRDLVTGLFNRQHFIEHLQRAIGAATQSGENSALLYMSIDKFNDIKNTVGLSGSDLVIADVGKVLDELSGDDHTVARFEGETFAMLTSQWDKDGLEALMTKLRASVADNLCEVEGKTFNCTISIGAALIDENTPEENDLLLRAERACDEAHKAGGNRAIVYRPKEGEMTQKQIDEDWSRRIREAVKENRLRLLFQPVVSLQGESGERYEVFLRMLDPEGAVIPPAEFMPSAERTGMATALDRWVIVSALKRLAERRKEHPDTIFFVKLSVGTLQDAEMLPWISEKIKEIRMPAENLVLELKESTVVNHLKQAKEFVKGLRALRCQFGLEDFGSGLNPFQLLKHLAVDFVKVDGAFVTDLHDNQENQETIRSITETAHSMNKLVIVPQVADPNTLSVLWGVGANFIQGHFLQEPSEELNYDFSTMA